MALWFFFPILYEGIPCMVFVPVAENSYAKVYPIHRMLLRGHGGLLIKIKPMTRLRGVHTTFYSITNITEYA